MEDSEPKKAEMGRMRYLVRLSMLLFQYVFDHAVDFVTENTRVMIRERELFLGLGLFLLGFFNFNVGKYCDGNSADYLSCTRPAVYYYFDAMDMVLIILGVFLVVVWFVKRQHADL